MKRLSGLIEYKGIEVDYTAEISDHASDTNPDRITDLDASGELSADEKAIWEEEWESIEEAALEDALEQCFPTKK